LTDERKVQPILAFSPTDIDLRLRVFYIRAGDWMASALSLVDRLGYSTIRIECKLSSRRISTGTGFFFDFLSRDGHVVPAIVGNRHTIEGAASGKLRFTAAASDGSPDDGNYYTFSLYDFEELWVPHPDPGIDLSVMQIAPILAEMKKKGVSIFYQPYNASFVPSREVLSGLHAVEDIVMIGYPNGLWDKKNNLPIFRKGITATHPKFNYNGRDEFLIDAACFPGSSGSPVLHLDVGNYVRSGILYRGDRVTLLGVLYAGPQYTISGDIAIVNVPTVQKSVALSRIPNNIGIVIKAGKVLDFGSILKSDDGMNPPDFMVSHSAARRRRATG